MGLCLCGIPALNQGEKNGAKAPYSNLLQLQINL